MACNDLIQRRQNISVPCRRCASTCSTKASESGSTLTELHIAGVKAPNRPESTVTGIQILSPLRPVPHQPATYYCHSGGCAGDQIKIRGGIGYLGHPDVVKWLLVANKTFW